MRLETILTHEFVEFIPDHLKEGTIYVSMEFATVAHKCCCGCGTEVVTPLSPSDWKLVFDGKVISLYPSIGNWGLNCQSHYWICNSRVRWAAQMSKNKIDARRSHSLLANESYIGESKTNNANYEKENIREVEVGNRNDHIWQKLKKWLV